MTRSNLFTGLRFVIAVSVLCSAFAIQPGRALAATDEEATALCTQELVETRGAEEFQRSNTRRRKQVRFVYGTAKFADSGDIRIRCRVYRGAVISLSYLVKDPEFVNGTRWVEERPSGTNHQGLVLDDDAMALPPVTPAKPRFEKAPE